MASERFPKVLSGVVSSVVVSLSVFVSGCSDANVAVTCAKVLSGTTQLITVVTEGMNTPQAWLQTFERATPNGRWVAMSAPVPAIVGRAGVGWGGPFRFLAQGQEPVKNEGDGRTPAGVYRLGMTFGFEPSDRMGYLKLEAGLHICVDDLASPLYGRIVSREQAGATTSGEEMRGIDLYKRGIVVSYPTDRSKRSGSCIFIHIWHGADKPTSGCVALEEGRVAQLQDWSASAPTAIAIWPRNADRRLQQCLPGLPLDDMSANQDTP